LSLRFRLVVFDLDGTLIIQRGHIWKTLHESLGSDLIARDTLLRQGLSGEISYADWFKGDLQLLKEAGATREAFERIAKGLRATPGTLQLIAALRSHGAKVAIISGGLDVIMEVVFPSLELDALAINRVHFHPDGSIASGDATPYDMARKADGLRVFAEKFGVPLRETAFVGDGDNDVEIAKLAGFSVAWGTVPKALERVSDVRVQADDLRVLRPYFFD
jgi:phosphoserine phosphatase